MRYESTNSVPCGQESESDELTIPGPNTSSGITSKSKGRHKGEKMYLSRQQHSLMHNDGDFEPNDQIICNKYPEWRHRRDLSEQDHEGNHKMICGRNAVIHEFWLDGG